MHIHLSDTLNYLIIVSYISFHNLLSSNRDIFSLSLYFFYIFSFFLPSLLLAVM